MFFPQAGAPDPNKSKPIQAVHARAIKNNQSGLNFQESDFESPETLELINDLSSEEFKIRNDAINELSKSNDPNVLDSLIKLLSRGDIVSRRSSAYVLGNLHKPEVIYLLSRVLKEDDEELIANSIGALENIVLNRNEQYELVIDTKINLEKIDIVSKALIECLEKLKKNEDYYYTSLSAALLLGHLGKPEAVEILVDCLSNSDEDISNREQAKDSLGKIKDTKTLEQVSPFLSDEYPMRTRQYALDIVSKLAESKIMTDSTVNSLKKCLRDPDTRIRLIATEIFKKLF